MGELQVPAQPIQLSTEPMIGHRRTRHPLDQGDSFDITFTPRGPSRSGAGGGPPASPLTPRQRDLWEQLELPSLAQYPAVPGCDPDDHEEEQGRKLLELYREFVLDLHTGMYLTQLVSNCTHADIHCQLMEDMSTLKLDQNTGRIIEFPLSNVSKVYRIVRRDDKWYATQQNGAALKGPEPANTEHVVVVEFMHRKLAFLFREAQASQRFLICIELLIRRAQQKQQASKTAAAATPTAPSAVAHAQERQQQHQEAAAAAQTSVCPTPRQVHEAEARNKRALADGHAAAPGGRSPSSLAPGPLAL